ncbi:MAG: caspase family protein [Pseudomonadota bacterium]
MTISPFPGLRFIVLAIVVSLGVVATLAEGPRANVPTQLQDVPRHAIVIGNAAYTRQPLYNPVNDARAMSSALSELGFEVSLLEDADHERMVGFVEEVAAGLTPGSMVMFFYAGHALQHEGVNWLVPVDFEVPGDLDLSGVALGLDRVLETLDEAGASVKVVVLDACRDYPLGEAHEAFGSGLAGIAASGETLIAYATSAGEVAFDGTGPNSPYTGALVSALQLEGLDIYDVFRAVRFKVRNATNGQQLPWVSGSVESRIVLREQSTVVASAERVTDIGVEDVHWQAIANSANPKDFELFTTVHSGSPLVAEAQVKLATLQLRDASPIPFPEVVGERLQGTPFTVTACDQWVSSPLDPRRVSDGVPWGVVNTRDAVRDCSVAVADDPENPRLAFNLGRALDIAERFDTARRFYERAAAEGYGAAHRNLGYMYRSGRGVEPDERRAAMHYFQAVETGLPAARSALGKLYEQGWGVPQSTREMLRWLELAADDNFPSALDHLGNIYRVGKAVDQDLDRARDYYMRAAALEHSNAVANVARLYRDGLGVEPDAREAIRWYEKAVGLGNPFAPYHLARMLLSGKDGVERDPERARELLEISVDRGYGWALWQLARSWERGDFGRPSPVTAARYLRIAEAAGRGIRTGSGEKLAQEAGDKYQALTASLSPVEIEQANRQADLWIRQNSLYDFSLIYPY